MSKLFDGFRSSGKPAATWFLKGSDDREHGPYDMSVLRKWAAQGRVEPGNRVSTDGNAWIPAESVPDLKMDWLVKLKDGSEYGPFDLLAAPHLIEKGMIDEDAVLRHKVTGKHVRVDTLVVPKAERGKRRTKEPVTAAKAGEQPPVEISGTDDGKQPVADDAAPGGKGIEAAERTIAELKEAIEKHTELLRLKQEESQKREFELNGRIEQLQGEASTASAKVADVSRQLSEEMKRREESDSNAASREREFAARIVGLSDETAGKERALREAEKQLQAKIRENQELSAIARQTEQELNARMEELRRKVAVSEKESAHLGDKLREAEIRHKEALATAGAKEQRLDERIIELEKEAGISAALLEEARSDIETLQEECAAIEGSVVHKEAELIKKSKGDLDHLREQYDSLRVAGEQREQALQDRVKQMSARSIEVEQKAQQASKDLDSERSAHSQTRTQSSQREQDLLNRIKEFEKAGRETLGLLEKAEQNLADQQKVFEETRQTASRKEAEMAALAEKLKKDADVSAARIAGLQAELKTEKALRTESEQKAVAREKLLRERMQSLQEASDGASAALEKTHQELEKSNAQHRQLLQASGTKESELSARVEHLDVAHKAAAAEVVRLEGELRKEKEARAGLKQTTSQETERMRTALKALEEQLASTTAGLQRAERDLGEARQKNSALKEELVRQEKETTERIRKMREGKPAARWYVKLDGESVYGPVTLSTIGEWADAGRIGPDHQVSLDKETWRAAKSLRYLKMDWMVALPDGTSYGPLNLYAIRCLLNDGRIPAEARITNRITGAATDAGKVLTPEVLELKDQNALLLQEAKRKDELLKAEQERIRNLREQLAKTQDASKENSVPVTTGSPQSSSGTRE